MNLTHSDVFEHLTASVAQQPTLPPPTVETLPITEIDPITLAFICGFVLGNRNDRK